MSRQRTATAILDARGAFTKDPQRKRVDPVSNAPFPETAPSWTSPAQLQWYHRVREAVPAGILQNADVFVVQLLAQLLSEFHTDPEGMATARMAQMRAVMGSLGLSPADRAKLATAPQGSDDEF